MRKLNIAYTKDFAGIYSENLFLMALKNSVLMVVGGTGLFGTYLSDFIMYLNENHDFNTKVIVTTRNKKSAENLFQEYTSNMNFDIIENDISSQGLSYSSKVDFVIHAASNTHPLQYSNDPIGTILTNVIGTKNVLDFAVGKHTKRVLLLSSVEIYGKIEKESLINENDLGYIDSNTLRAGYPESKRTSETLCNAYNKVFGQDFVVARLCRLYGPTVRENDSKAINQFLFKALKGKDIVLKSNGEQYFSFLHVADAVIASLFLLIKGESSGAYNVANHKSNIKLKNLAKKIASIVQKDVKFDIPDFDEIKGFSTAVNAAMSSQNIENLGWTPFYNIDTGINNTFTVLKSFKLQEVE